jgi:hypothetical protein
MENNTTSPAHTAGPWTLEPCDDMDNTVELRGDSGSRHLGYLPTQSEASSDDYDSREAKETDVEEYAANASLIATTPELLAMCKDLISTLRDIGDGEKEVLEHNVQALLADAEDLMIKAEVRMPR